MRIPEQDFGNSHLTTSWWCAEAGCSGATTQEGEGHTAKRAGGKEPSLRVLNTSSSQVLAHPLHMETSGTDLWSDKAWGEEKLLGLHWGVKGRFMGTDGGRSLSHQTECVSSSSD